MQVVRRFLLAPAIARLIMRERPAIRVVEGHFLPSDERLSYVMFEDNTCNLVLVTNPGSTAEEQERTEVPARQGQFLLEVCAGTLVSHRVWLPIGNGREALISSFSIPGSLHLIEVEFESEEQAEGFVPPLWFGPAADDRSFNHNAMATRGISEQPLVLITDEGLHAVLDALDEANRSRRSLPHGVEPFRAIQRAEASSGS